MADHLLFWLLCLVVALPSPFLLALPILIFLAGLGTGYLLRH